MDEIRRKVRTAQRRLNAELLLQGLAWSLFAGLWLAAVGVAIPKLLLIQGGWTWFWSWVGGSLSVALVAAVWATYRRRRHALDAAIELDRRCQLRERVASALSLRKDELESEAGRALLADAQRRVEQVEVAEHFRVQPSWKSLLPLLPALLVGVLALVADRQAREANASNTAGRAETARIDQVTQQLAKQIERRKKLAAEQGLKEIENAMQQLESQLADLRKQETPDRKQALIKLNDLSQELTRQRDELGGSEELKRQLQRLADSRPGPMSKFGQALQNGDLRLAKQELDKLREALKDGKLTPEEQAKLAEQMQAMQDKLQSLKDAFDQAKADLQEQIKQRQAAGDLQGAAKLQAQLDQLNSQNQQMQQLQQMANQLQQAAGALKQGDLQQASKQLQQMAGQLQDAQNQLDQLESLDGVLNQISEAKNAMCEGGQGQAGQQGQGQQGQQGQPGQGGQGDGQGQGNGLGQGQGQGERPESATDTGTYSSRVAQQPKPGEIVRDGFADGPNRAGVTRESIKQEISRAYDEDSDPVNSQPLPKFQQEHTREYFNRLRQGE